MRNFIAPDIIEGQVSLTHHPSMPFLHIVRKTDMNPQSPSEPRSFVQTGIFGLDEILMGGVIRGNVIILEGMPGTGKTTFALEFIYRGITGLRANVSGPFRSPF